MSPRSLCLELVVVKEKTKDVCCVSQVLEMGTDDTDG